MVRSIPKDSGRKTVEVIIFFISVLVVTFLAIFIITIISIGMVVQKARMNILDIRSQYFQEKAQEILNAYLLVELPVSSITENKTEYLLHLDSHFKIFKLKLERPGFLFRRTRVNAIRETMLSMTTVLSGETRYRLDYAFEKIGFIDEEMKNLYSNEWWVRANACRHMNMMHASKATSRLVQLLEDEEEDVRIEAAQALLEIDGVQSLSSILLTLKDISLWMQIRISQTILRMGAEAVEHLNIGVRSEYLTIQLFCLEMLGSIGDISAVPTILEYIGYRDIVVQEKSLIALGKLGDERSIPVLIEFLHHQRPELRSAAARALGFVRSPDTLGVLSQSLMEDIIEVKLSAGEAIARFGEDGVPVLQKILASSNNESIAVAHQYLHEQQVTIEGDND